MPDARKFVDVSARTSVDVAVVSSQEGGSGLCTKQGFRGYAFHDQDIQCVSVSHNISDLCKGLHHQVCITKFITTQRNASIACNASGCHDATRSGTPEVISAQRKF
jgi:hypothetical protein